MFSGARYSTSGGGDRRSDSSGEGEADQIRGLKLLIAELREQLKSANEMNKSQLETTQMILDNMNAGGGGGGAVETLRVQELEAEIEGLQVDLASREGLLNETMDEQRKLQDSVDLWRKRAKSLEEALDLRGIDWEREEDWKKILDKIKKMKDKGEGIKEFADRLQKLATGDDNLEEEMKVPPKVVVKTMEPPILKKKSPSTEEQVPRGPPCLTGPFSGINTASTSGAADDDDLDIIEELIGIPAEVPKPSTSRIRKPTSKADEFARRFKKPRQSDPGRFPCQLCTTSFTKVETLKNHLLTKHNLVNLKEYETGCELCGKFMKSVADLDEHLKIAHGGSDDAANSDHHPGAGPSSGATST